MSADPFAQLDELLASRFEPGWWAANKHAVGAWIAQRPELLPASAYESVETLADALEAAVRTLAEESEPEADASRPGVLRRFWRWLVRLVGLDLHGREVVPEDAAEPSEVEQQHEVLVPPSPDAARGARRIGVLDELIGVRYRALDGDEPAQAQFREWLSRRPPLGVSGREHVVWWLSQPGPTPTPRSDVANGDTRPPLSPRSAEDPVRRVVRANGHTPDARERLTAHLLKT